MRPAGRSLPGRLRRRRSATSRCRCWRPAWSRRSPTIGGTRSASGLTRTWRPPSSGLGEDEKMGEAPATDTNRLQSLWDNREAARLAENPLELLRYRSNLLGADLRITN